MSKNSSSSPQTCTQFSLSEQQIFDKKFKKPQTKIKLNCIFCHSPTDNKIQQKPLCRSCAASYRYQWRSFIIKEYEKLGTKNNDVIQKVIKNFLKDQASNCEKTKIYYSTSSNSSNSKNLNLCKCCQFRFIAGNILTVPRIKFTNEQQKYLGYFYSNATNILYDIFHPEQNDQNNQKLPQNLEQLHGSKQSDSCVKFPISLKTNDENVFQQILDVFKEFAIDEVNHHATYMTEIYSKYQLRDESYSNVTYDSSPDICYQDHHLYFDNLVYLTSGLNQTISENLRKINKELILPSKVFLANDKFVNNSAKSSIFGEPKNNSSCSRVYVKFHQELDSKQKKKTFYLGYLAAKTVMDISQYKLDIYKYLEVFSRKYQSQEKVNADKFEKFNNLMKIEVDKLMNWTYPAYLRSIIDENIQNNFYVKHSNPNNPYDLKQRVYQLMAYFKHKIFLLELIKNFDPNKEIFFISEDFDLSQLAKNPHFDETRPHQKYFTLRSIANKIGSKICQKIKSISSQISNLKNFQLLLFSVYQFNYQTVLFHQTVMNEDFMMALDHSGLKFMYDRVLVTWPFVKGCLKFYGLNLLADDLFGLIEELAVMKDFQIEGIEPILRFQYKN